MAELIEASGFAFITSPYALLLYATALTSYYYIRLIRVHFLVAC